MTVSPQIAPQVWTSAAHRCQSRREYATAVRQPHGSIRRFLSGCRCDRCDRSPNRSFRERLLDYNLTAWITSA